METILITGGSGIIGKSLSDLLSKNNYQVRHLSRTVNGQEKYATYKWDLSKNYIDPKALNDVDHIIHLAGENVSSGRWNASRKNRILSSRVDTLTLLQNNLNERRIKTMVSASGISYYGSVTTDTIFKETDAVGTDFLAEVSEKWEAAAFKFNAVADRVVALRTGVVLSPTGGALASFVKPMKLGIGSPLGSGNQYMPWLHLDDICGMYLKAVQDDHLSGSYNAVASDHHTNKEVTQAIAKVMGKKLWAPKVPGFLLKLLFGEMAVIILEGSRIDNTKIKETGFQFKFDNLNSCLEDLLGK